MVIFEQVRYELRRTTKFGVRNIMRAILSIFSMLVVMAFATVSGALSGELKIKDLKKGDGHDVLKDKFYIKNTVPYCLNCIN